jgi:hypothetical protein
MGSSYSTYELEQEDMYNLSGKARKKDTMGRSGRR